MMGSRRGWRVWLLALLAIAVVTRAGSIDERDDAGRRVRLSAPAERVVSLAPHLTELLYAVGAGDRVVGAVDYSDYPPEAQSLPRVGDAFRIDIERVLALRPDLVVAWHSGNPASDVAHLRRLGITVYYSEPHGLDGVAAQVEALGRLTGREAQASRTSQAFRAGLAALRARYRDRRRVSVFYQIAAQPLYTIGGPHLINEAIDLCGGRNIFSDVDSLAPIVSIEAVLSAMPDAIVASGHRPGDVTPLEQWRRWPRLPAVRDDHLFIVNPDLLNRATPRMLSGIERLCMLLDRARERDASD